jgi:hypothetical protein
MPDTPGDAVSAWLRAMLDAALEPTQTRIAALERLIAERLPVALPLPEPSAPPPGPAPQPEPEPAPPVAQDPSPEPAPIVVTPTPEPQPAPAGANMVEIISASGAVWPLDLGDIQPGKPRRVEAEVPASVVGCTSMRLAVDVGVASNGTVWADVAPRNDISMREGGGNAAPYTLRVVLNGQEQRRWDVPRHPQYIGWLRQVATGPMPDLVWPSQETLDAAGVANYVGSVTEERLASYAAAMADPSWDDLFSPRCIAQYMPGVGGRDDIGPATMAQAVALISRDPRAVAYLIGQAEAAAGIPWHHWDAARGSWLSVKDYPRIWTDSRGAGQAGGTLLQPVPGDTGWGPESAHQPDLNFVAYLLTGRRAFLDELQAQAAWNIISQWSDQRGESDMLVVNGNQVRGSAWALRQIDEAAWASPDGSVEKAYFTAAAEANWQWIVDNIPIWTQQQGEAHGWLPGEYGTKGAMPPWQQDYFASFAIASARRGNPHALTFLRWASNFLVGRFKALGHDGAAYLLAISDAKSGKIYSTWAEIQQQTKARGQSNGAGWDRVDGNYAQWARATMAGLADLLDDPEARRLVDWLPAEGAPWTQPEDFVRDPLLSVAPAATQ